MDSSEILERLKKLGKVTDDDIVLVRKSVDDDLYSLATTMHSLLCKDRHNTLEEYTVGVVGCDFYAEEKTENAWSKLIHRKWVSLAKIYSQYFPNYTNEPEKIVEICNAVLLMLEEDNYEVIKDIFESLVIK